MAANVTRTEQDWDLTSDFQKKHHPDQGWSVDQWYVDRMIVSSAANLHPHMWVTHTDQKLSNWSLLLATTTTSDDDDDVGLFTI